MVSLIQTIILSIIQGVTEWLPISSSGHLALFHNFFNFQSLSFDVFLHFASILAAIIIFRKDILNLLNFKKIENLNYILYIIIAIIPAGIIGFFYKEKIGEFFSNMIYLGFFFIISGILIYSTKFSKEKRNKINFLDSIFIGIFQAIAILPGISRSGATISSGMFRGLKKEEAIKFSFLLAIPIIFGASLIELKELAVSDISYNMLIISFLITFFVSLFSIKLLMNIVKNERFYLFGFYNMFLGIIILFLKL